MLTILGLFDKQPGETLDYNFDLTAWLASKAGDTITSFTISADPGITIVSSSKTGGVIKVFVSGGTDGVNYKITCTVSTAGGRVKQGEIEIAVVEI